MPSSGVMSSDTSSPIAIAHSDDWLQEAESDKTKGLVVVDSAGLVEGEYLKFFGDELPLVELSECFEDVPVEVCRTDFRVQIFVYRIST